MVGTVRGGRVSDDWSQYIRITRHREGNDIQTWFITVPDLYIFQHNKLRLKDIATA